MQNKQLHSNWQQESNNKNFIEFVQYWPFGCQRVKWEILKKEHTKNQPPTAPKTIIKKIINNKKRVLWLYFSKTR